MSISNMMGQHFVGLLKVIAASGSSIGWNLNGNSGTTSGTNFIGTVDNQALVIKVSTRKWLNFNGFPSNHYIGTNIQRTT
ncbi:MAG: hypothetical protein IPO92_15195 [Saprospiraceae bacterium]|nr:hypothetical protein [Saprospiraceae bacterium]